MGENLTKTDARVLDGLLKDRRLSSRHLLQGGTQALDIMGVLLDPKTNEFYPGAKEGLQEFAVVMKRHDVMIIATSNGPDQPEGKFFLDTIPDGIPTFVVTQGGGKITFKHPSGLREERRIAHPDDMAKLDQLETQAEQKYPLVAALLRDRHPTDGYLPSRTEYYDTNTVITLPAEYEVFMRRMRAEDVTPNLIISGLDQHNYIPETLGHIRSSFLEIINDPDLNFGVNEAYLEGMKAVQVVVKPTNRRVYAMPSRLFILNAPLNKRTGATLGMIDINEQVGLSVDLFRRYELPRSGYTADGARIDDPGGPQIGSAEESMIKGMHHFFGGPDPEDNIIGYYSNPQVTSPGSLTSAETSARLVMNVTLKDSPIRMDWVQGVPMLDVRSGPQALKAWVYLYDHVDRPARAA